MVLNLEYITIPGKKKKSVKQEVLLVIHVKKWAILLQSADLKTKQILSMKRNQKTYIYLNASESDSVFANNITPKTEEKKLSKVNCEINSVDINFLVDSGASVNTINIKTLQKISKVCEIGLETTYSKIYTLGSNNPSKLKAII